MSNRTLRCQACAKKTNKENVMEVSFRIELKSGFVSILSMQFGISPGVSILFQAHTHTHTHMHTHWLTFLAAAMFGLWALCSICGILYPRPTWTKNRTNFQAKTRPHSFHASSRHLRHPWRSLIAGKVKKKLKGKTRNVATKHKPCLSQSDAIINIVILIILESLTRALA